MKRPFVLIGSSMFISLIICNYCEFYITAAVFGICALLTFPLFLLRHKHKVVKSTFICICALLVSTGTYAQKTVTEFVPSQMLADCKDCEISGTFTQYSNLYGNHYYTLKNISVNGRNTNQKIRIDSKFYIDADIDDTLIFSVDKINAIESNTAVMNHKADGVYITAYNQADVTLIKAEKHSPLYYLNSLKQLITENLQKNLNTDYAPAVDAMITGNKENLDTDIQSDFSYSGISHLFAVSGFHLTLWTSAIYFLFINLFGENKKILRNCISIGFVIFFMALTGFSQSVVRAGIMQIIMFAGGFTKYKADPLNSLFIALTAIITVNPFAVMSISLQMSFFATLGIITLSRPVTEVLFLFKKNIKLTPLYRVIASLYTIVAVSIIGTLFTVPISAQSFGYYSIAAPLTNLLCMPFAQFIMPLSILGIIFSGLPPAAKILNLLCNLIMKYICTVTDAVSHQSWAVVDAQPAEVFISLFAITFALIIFLPFFDGKNRALRRIVALCTSCLVFVSVAAEISTAKNHKITVADVGNGTSIIYNAGNKNIIIGCGGSKYREYKLTNLTYSINAKKIDLLVIPRNIDTESEYMHTMLRLHNYDNILICEDEFSFVTEKTLPENVVRKSECEIKIDEKTNLVYINNSNFSGVRINSKDFSCTIIFKSVTDFSVVPSEWKTGDLLITRQNLPDTDISGFKTIFISTNDTTVYDNANIYTTGANGKLTYRTTMTGGEKIYAAK